MEGLPSSPKSARGRRIVAQASISIALGLIIVGVLVGALVLSKFEETLERDLKIRLEGYAQMAASRFDVRDLKRLSDSAENIAEEDLIEYHWAKAVSQQLGIRRLVIFDRNGLVAVDSQDAKAGGKINATLLVNEAEFSDAISSGAPKTTVLFEIEVDGEKSESQTSFAALPVPNGAEELERYVVGVELPVDYEEELAAMREIIALWVGIFIAITIGLTAAVIVFFSRQQEKTEELRRKAELADFSGAIAHEIKNPLAAMLTGLQLLSRSLDDKQRKIGNRLEREIHVLDRIVKDFLAFARGAANKPEAISMGAVIARVRQQLTPEQEAALRLKGDANLPLFIDSVALVQAIANLVKNASQAALEAEHEDGRDAEVTISYHSQQEQVIISITDNGLGVTESVKGRLFSPFVSGRSEGTGLGLAIVRRFVEDLKGEVELMNSAESGANFVLKVPQGKKEQQP